MTNQEAIEMLIAKAECTRRDSSGIDVDCNLRNCDECDLCYKQGTMGDQMEALGVAISALQAQDVPDINVGDMVSMSGTSYIGDGFFYSQEMREQARRLEEMTNPLFVPESFAGVAYLRGGNYGCREHYGYGAHIGMTREELDMLHDAEMRKAERRQE